MCIADNDNGDPDSIIDRKLVFCNRLQTFDTKELITACPDCHRSFVYCCSYCWAFPNAPRPCHHYRIIFTGSACHLNGQVGATAGIGIVYGEDTPSQVATPITSSLDPGQQRTSRRTELLAVLIALKLMVVMDRQTETALVERDVHHRIRHSGKAWVFATDSEYVVKGMTEWLRGWKKNNLRTNRGTVPANLDLFLKLDEEVTMLEAQQNVEIGFWRVPLECNTTAYALAKDASTMENWNESLVESRPQGQNGTSEDPGAAL